jgi:hypothetical protein
MKGKHMHNLYTVGRSGKYVLILRKQRPLASCDVIDYIFMSCWRMACWLLYQFFYSSSFALDLWVWSIKHNVQRIPLIWPESPHRHLKMKNFTMYKSWNKILFQTSYWCQHYRGTIENRMKKKRRIRFLLSLPYTVENRKCRCQHD